MTLSAGLSQEVQLRDRKGVPVIDDDEVPSDPVRPGVGSGPYLLVATSGLVLAVAVALQVLADGTRLAEISYLAVLGGSAVAAWVGAQHHHAGRRLVPRLIAAGLSCSALGDLLWSVLDWGGADTDASIADAAWFASYLLLCAALWVVLSRTDTEGHVDLDFLVDVVTVVVISVVVFWRLSVESIVADSSQPALVRAVWAAYPVLDAILLALMIRVLLSRSARAAVGAWFAVGVCLWLAADVLYLLVPAQDAAIVSMNAAWMLAPVLMARAVWTGDDSVPDPSGSTLRTSPHAGWLGALLVAVCPLIVPPALELTADVRGQPDRPGQLFVGMALVIALAFVRTGRLIVSEQRAQRELEAARDKALAASDAKSIFLATMSHEIRTPLTTVLASAELLEDTRLDDLQLRLVEKMGRSGDQLLRLVESILDFSRIEAGQVELQHERFDLHDLVTEVVDVHLVSAEGQGIELSRSLDPTVPEFVTGDRTRVFQVLNNLIVNALKFTDRGRVHLDVCSVGDPGGTAECCVEFRVIDTGVGIRSEDQVSIFESFSQVDGTATRRYEGSGLGLAICRELTGLMGGTVVVDSEFGAGSTFTVRLPFGRDVATPDAPCPNEPERELLGTDGR